MTPWYYHMQPLYRRGPCLFSSHIESAAWPQQPPHASYGPPLDDHDLLFAIQDQRRRQFDHRLFSLYFLVAEALATYLAYRIAQHCLKQCRLKFLSPTMRLLIGVFYCSLKLKLIDYAFHASIYFTCSVGIMVVYYLYAFAALGFHSGPLQFLFFDGAPPQPNQLLAWMNNMRFRVLQTLVEVRDVHLKTNNSSEDGIAQLPMAFGTVVTVKIDQWNKWMAQHYASTLVSTAKNASTERRFVAVIQHDGLILSIYLMGPTATMMMNLYVPETMRPFEIVLRLLMATKPVFLYAESRQLVGRTNSCQQKALLQFLRQLNACVGVRVDVALRALRCKNFVEADVGRITRKKPKRLLLTEFDRTFG